jgi:hypothetical protein
MQRTRTRIKNTTVGLLTTLTRLDIVGNAQIDGTIPLSLSALATALRTLNIHGNAQLSGPIPGPLTTLTATAALRFDGSPSLCILDAGRWCDCTCDIHLCSLSCCSLGGASALVAFICVLFRVAPYECSCDVHVCSLHSADANFTMMYATLFL